MSLPDDFEVRVGDALEELEKLPDESVQMCVTSPPYWGLRDYGVDGQLGLEPTPEEYVENLTRVFREVRRVLRPDGALWLNLGDSYASGGMSNPSDSSTLGGGKHLGADEYNIDRSAPPGLKPKDMVGIPWRVAFALQADGWWLRSDIIWHKPNPMPESVTDRPTSSHEHIFLLAKSEQYYYDHEAIAEPCGTDPSERYPQRARVTGRGDQEYAAERGRDRGKSGGFPPDGSGRNKRDVWEVTTKPYPDAHFAVYPPDLIAPCIKAGTSQRGQCVKCGAPWERELESESASADADRAWQGVTPDQPNRSHPQEPKKLGSVGTPESETVGWSPTCDCDADTEPQLVLDPFAGAGTTGVVCTELGRRFIGIELNDEYAEMARERIMETNPTLFRETA